MDLIRIASDDGTTRNVVVSTKDGKQIDRIRSLTITGDSDDALLVVALELWMPKIDITAHPGEITFACPLCYEASSHKCGTQSMSLP